MPKVSVIVTTFNRKEHLAETIQSILNQTYQDFELIVIDNYSNYDFLAHIKSFNSDKIIALQNSNNGVIAVNRNMGMKHAKGEYLAFCDDDDNWMPDKLEKQIDFIKNNKLEHKKVVIYSNCLNIYSNKQVHTTKREIHTINDFIYRSDVTFSSSLVSNVGLRHQFNELPEFIAVEDYLFWCTLKLEGYQFFLLKDSLVKYYVSPTSATGKNYGVNHLKNILVLTLVLLRSREVSLSYFHFCFSVIRHMLKFSIKRVIANNKI